MTSEDKLAALFRQVEDNLDEAEKAKIEGNVKIFSRKIWEVGADLEYLTFTMGLSRENADDSWKEKLKAPRAIDIHEEILKVKSLLKEAFSAIDADFEGVYRKVWLARGIMLRVQKESEKSTTGKSY